MILTCTLNDRIYIPRIRQLEEFYQEISENFTYANPKYAKTKAMGYFTGNMEKYIKNWNYAIHPDYGESMSIPRGGIEKLRHIASQYNFKLSFKDKRLSCEPVTNLYNDLELWPEQKVLADLMFKHQNCLIRSPTGSGKTETALKVIEWILKDAGPVLIIVWEGSHKSGLFGQWVKRACQRFGLTKDQIGIIQGQTKRVRPITIGMQQTLKNVGRKYINQFGGIICDEIQRFAAPTFRDVIDIYPAKYRIGISADETRKDKQEFFIYDCFGSVVGEIEKETLVKKHKIHEVDIRIVPSNFDYAIMRGDEEVHWNDLSADEKNFNDLLDAMIADEERDEVIWPYVYSCLKTDHTLMLATTRVEHARMWDKRIRDAGFSCGLMLGGVSNEDEFQSTVEALCERKIKAGVGTIQKIAQGLDVPTWDRGFVLSPLASNRQRMEQLFGRLRRTAPGKKDAVVYYLFDQHVYPYHLTTLKRLYRKHVYYPDDNGKFKLIN